MLRLHCHQQLLRTEIREQFQPGRQRKIKVGLRQKYGPSISAVDTITLINCATLVRIEQALDHRDIQVTLANIEDAIP